jgi:GDPmannose 4,6-dehydratase
MPHAFLTGITGQDGSHLAEFLLARGYSVTGLVRRTSGEFPWRLVGVRGRVRLVEGDVLDLGSLLAALEASRPDEIYHLAAQSFVGASFDQPELTANVTGLGTVRLLEAVRRAAPSARVYHASSSEMFGQPLVAQQNESTPFRPRSPHGAAKAFAHHMAVNAREAHGLHVACGILFNHEGPRRGIEFGDPTHHGRRRADQTRAGEGGDSRQPRRASGLGRRSTASKRCGACSNILSRTIGVIATGVSHSVAEWCEAAFAHVGLDWKDHVRVDPARRRPSDISGLVGDASRARNVSASCRRPRSGNSWRRWSTRISPGSRRRNPEGGKGRVLAHRCRGFRRRRSRRRPSRPRIRGRGSDAYRIGPRRRRYGGRRVFATRPRRMSLTSVR